MTALNRTALHRIVAAVAATGAAAGLAAIPMAQAGASTHSSYLGRFPKISTIASTVPRNGDVNPYGIAVIRHSQGRLRRGHILISNFNNKKNLQGTGTTLVEISPRGHRTLFAQLNAKTLPGSCPGGLGLSTALAVLPGGWVVVGSTPSSNGMAATAKAGCLIVLNSRGRAVETIAGQGINGPWDATWASLGGGQAALFVTNVLNGTVAAQGKVVHRGTVLRLDLSLSAGQAPQLMSVTKVGSGFAEQTNPSAFVLGPTGVGLSPQGTLYVAETQSNTIRAIPDALTRMSSGGNGTVLTAGRKLSMPLGLTLAPNGDVLTVNGGNGLIVETTPAGQQIATRLLDSSGSPKGAGALFGLTLRPHASGVYYVDDAANTLKALH
jgi:hypothetical protein